MNPREGTAWIVERARALGFDLCGVAPAEGLAELARLPEWLARGYAGEMAYLRDPRRTDPRRVLAGARSLIVCALNYNTALPCSTEFATDAPRGWVSRYAWGEDYHRVVGQRLDALLRALRQRVSEPFEARVYVDTGPLVERVAAKYAGLGWLGKNTCLINEQVGSWLFLGVIITTLELAPSLGPAEPPPADLCGQCRLCLDACPTGAIVEPYLLDARRCISYLTIELRGAIPEEFRPAVGRHVFGCDICQDVCPWNRRAPVTALAAFQPRRTAENALPAKKPARMERAGPRPLAGEKLATDLFAPDLEWLAALTEEQFGEIFRGSAMRRAKWRGLLRNACVALGNWLRKQQAWPPARLPDVPGETPPGLLASQRVRERIRYLLERLAASDDLLIAEHARWALEASLAGQPGLRH